jgi:mRNA-degrading endonuclease toxin of MazEF toxin-antitoxin module
VSGRVSQDHLRYLAGAVYFVNDSDIMLPAGEMRATHTERRPVVVVSDQNEQHGTNAEVSGIWPSVLVVPISSSTRYRTRFDVKLGAGEGNLSKKGWARVPALQVMDKEHLDELIGHISGDKLDELTAQILNYLGIIEPDLVEDEDDEF